ncbi:MAG: response regulator transcription factor [Micrococcaceae bacterium]
MKTLHVRLITGDHFLRIGIDATLGDAESIVLDYTDSPHPTEKDLVTADPLDIVLYDATTHADQLSGSMRVLRDRSPQTKVVVLIASTNSTVMKWAYGLGVSGFISKQTIDGHLTSALMMVQRGYTLFARPQDKQAFPPRKPLQWKQEKLLQNLPPREQELVRRLALGQTNREIASALNLSESSVKTGLTKLLAHLGLTNRVQLAVVAAEARLVSSDEFAAMMDPSGTVDYHRM